MNMNEEKIDKPKRKRKKSLNTVAKELSALAEAGGVEQNYFFTTTFARYKTQLDTMERLKEEFEGKDVLVKKEYVKGRENYVANPAISEFNKTSTAANQTVATLINIIKTFSDGSVMGGYSGNEDDIDL